MSLHGRTALVMGGGRNIGKEIALEMARQGASVAVNSRSNAQEAQEVAAEARALGVKAVAVLGDIAVRSDVDRVVRESVEALGHIDILFNTPGIRPPQKFLDITDEDWKRVMGVCLDGPFYACRAVIPGMVQRRWGRIINFSGATAFKGGGGMQHLQAAKTGILGLTRGLAIEFALSGITVNTIVPGRFETKRTTEWTMGGSRSLPASQSNRETSPYAAFGSGDPKDLAAFCAFLCSDAGRFINGQSLHLNGGIYVT